MIKRADQHFFDWIRSRAEKNRLSCSKQHLTCVDSNVVASTTVQSKPDLDN